MKLNKETAIEWWMDDLQGQLSAEQKNTLHEYLARHPELYTELLQSVGTWTELETLSTPSPSPQMEVRFQAMLEGYKAAEKTKSSWLYRLTHWATANWQTGLASLCIGLLIGFFLMPERNDEINALSSEVSQMKKLLVLSMIEKPQAQERIKAVNMVSDLRDNDDRIISSLIVTLNNDKSINVRLAALDALLSYGNQESVREALVRAIALQDSPLLQVALADAMVLLQEKEAIQVFSGILNEKSMDENVRLKLESTIETLKEI